MGSFCLDLVKETMSLGRDYIISINDDKVKRIVGASGLPETTMLSKENGIKLSAKRPRTRSQAAREKLKEDRENITLWKQPITTINYSTRELCITLLEWGQKSFEYKKT